MSPFFGCCPCGHNSSRPSTNNCNVVRVHLSTLFSLRRIWRILSVCCNGKGVCPGHGNRLHCENRVLRWTLTTLQLLVLGRLELWPHGQQPKKGLILCFWKGRLPQGESRALKECSQRPSMTPKCPLKVSLRQTESRGPFSMLLTRNEDFVLVGKVTFWTSLRS